MPFANAGSSVSVDTFLREQLSITDSTEAPLISLDPKAGPLFTLQRTVLDRLLANLVGNALEHGAPPFVIATSRDEKYWIISVRDHGAGIPEDQMAAVSKPFVRRGDADASNRHRRLGLAIVARLVTSEGALPSSQSSRRRSMREHRFAGGATAWIARYHSVIPTVVLLLFDFVRLNCLTAIRSQDGSKNEI